MHFYPDSSNVLNFAIWSWVQGFSESSQLSVSSLSSDFMCTDSVLDVDKSTESWMFVLLALFHKQSDWWLIANPSNLLTMWHCCFGPFPVATPFELTVLPSNSLLLSLGVPPMLARISPGCVGPQCGVHIFSLFHIVWEALGMCSSNSSTVIAVCTSGYHSCHRQDKD